MDGRIESGFEGFGIEMKIVEGNLENLRIGFVGFIYIVKGYVRADIYDLV